MSDVSKTNELIEEARFYESAGHVAAYAEGTLELLRKLADALESMTGVRVDMSSAVGVETQLAAARVPVQGEPNDDREAIAREVYRELYPGRIGTHDSKRTPESDLAESDLAYAVWDRGGEGFAPGRVCRRVADRVLSRATVPDAATAALERVRVLAYQHRSVEQHNEMVPMSDIADLIREPSSAEYLAALDGAPEPEAVEWEYAVGGMNPGSTEAWAHDEDDISSNFDTARAWTDEAIASGSFSNAIVVKRRVNPWLPVEGESK